ncbi:LysR family transcriptional regulator [Stappia sp. GBMRC 2046]|uniref:LysR family transcriptional regulator n=1 Tax=Stappia sediminis TaxID=2692190 RepID=A0A7X3LWF1_9HYPH|nr:LysR substrate-binding domain-containing protein [Stappia sediminis]MXN66303.1 LysR family transcriptional regulator [Stappia sediminis]
MELDLLRAFVAVAEASSFTHAAARIHKTQSTISQQVGRLERYLETVLFDRDTRRVRLTEEGERYLLYARRMLAIDEEGRAALRDKDREFLHVGIPEDFAVQRLPEVLARFAAKHRAVRLNVVAAPSVELQRRLEDGHLDIAVVKETAPPRDALACWLEPLSWVAGKEAGGIDERPVPLIAFPDGCSYRARATQALEAAGVGWRIAYESPNWSGVRAAVKSGLGVALLAETDRISGIRKLSEHDGFPAVEPTFLTVKARRRELSQAAKDLVDTFSGLVTQERKEADQYPFAVAIGCS